LFSVYIFANEYMKDHIYLNCGERYEFMIDHRSCEIKA